MREKVGFADLLFKTTGSGRPRRWAPTLGEATVTYQERERETIRRLREEVAARRDVPRPEWLVQANGCQMVQLDEVAELIFEVQN